MAAARGFHPIPSTSHRETLRRGQEGRGRGGNANQSIKAPPSRRFWSGGYQGLRTLGPPPGAEGRANRGSAFGNDSRFPVWFLRRGRWDMLTCCMCVPTHVVFLFSQGGGGGFCFFFLFATFSPLGLVCIFFFLLLSNGVRQNNGPVPSLLWGKFVEKER